MRINVFDLVIYLQTYCTDTLVAAEIVVGGWGSWTGWTECTDACGMGTQSRSRVCDNPPPANGGSDCLGDPTDSRECVCEWDFVASCKSIHRCRIQCSRLS